MIFCIIQKHKKIQVMTATMKDTDVEKVFEYIKPIIQRAVIEKFDISADRQEIIRIFLNVLPNRKIPYIFINHLEKSTSVNLWEYIFKLNFKYKLFSTSYLDLINLCRPNHVDFVVYCLTKSKTFRKRWN